MDPYPDPRDPDDRTGALRTPGDTERTGALHTPGDAERTRSEAGSGGGGDPALAARPADAAARAQPYGPRTVVATYASGFLMGSADLVPGVSGGTVALVLGIYERLIANIRQVARVASLVLRGRVRTGVRAIGHVEWSFVLPLLAGIGTALLTLARGLEHLLETEPVLLAAAFFGLVVGSVVVSLTELDDPGWRSVVTGVVTAVVVFLLLGLRPARFADPSLVVVFAGGAVAICAMILPGISGSFMLLLMGLYQYILGALNDRDVAVVGVFALGTVVGLTGFATLLNWLLRRYHDPVLAALIGLMVGSLRVVWPWPAGADGVGDTRLGPPVAGELPLAIALAVAGALGVVVIASVARAVSEADDRS